MLSGGVLPKMAITVRYLLWILLVSGVALILENSVDYFRSGDSAGFIEEKGVRGRDPLWLAILYLHVGGGLLGLLASLMQFSRSMLRRLPQLHRWLGRIYASSVIGFVGPSGLYLALFAKGGFWGRTGFLLLGVLTLHFTLQGVLALRGGRRDMIRHGEFMIRSFAMLTSAISFRIEHIGFHLLGLDDATSYLVSLWLSILGNAAVAEWAIIRWHRRAPLSSKLELQSS